MADNKHSYRFRPRFLGLAFLSLSLGVTLLAAAATLEMARGSQIIAGLAGMAGFFLGFAYLRSPVWRLAVDVRDDELVVWNGVEERLRLRWDEVKQLVTGPENTTLYVDGGSPDKSLLVPGPDAPASYDIRNKAKLIKELLAHVPSDRIVSAASLASSGSMADALDSVTAESAGDEEPSKA